MENYTYRGARALVILHEQHLREFVRAWKEAVKADLHLPQVDDSDYASLNTLLRHVMRAARGYMTWICEKLELPDPEIRATPDADVLEAELDSYLEHLLEHWKLPLVNVPEDRFHKPYLSRWKVEYCVDAMLEHAVMHPIRHSFQLRELMGKR